MRATAEQKAAKIGEATQQIRSALDALREIEDSCPVVDWASKLEEYLALHKQQGDSANTLKAYRSHLTYWVEWLVK